MKCQRNRRFIRTPGPFHVSARTNNREWFERPLSEVWELSSDLLAFTGRAFNLEIQAYVLMNNHYHLMVGAPFGNISEAMNYFQREFSKAMGRDTGRINRLFGGRYYATHVSGEQALHAIYRYVYRNPVDAGICSDVARYPFSSLRMLLGEERSMLPIIDPMNFCRGPREILDWLNDLLKKNSVNAFEKVLGMPSLSGRVGDPSATFVLTI